MATLRFQGGRGVPEVNREEPSLAGAGGRAAMAAWGGRK